MFTSVWAYGVQMTPAGIVVVILCISFLLALIHKNKYNNKF